MDENLKKGRDQAMEEQENKLGTAPIGKLLVQMSLPAITAQVINALYNIVDRIYIGHLPEVGSLALASLGVAFPLIMIISAFAALIGMGGAPRAAIAMGAGKKAASAIDEYIKSKKDEAEKILGNSFSALFLMSIVLTVLFLLTSDTLLTWFGATEKSLPMAKSYFTIYVLGTISVQMALGLNSFISAQGFSTMSMMTVLIGAISNIILDPILIYGFDMGVRGAAIATVFSQTVSAVWVIVFLTGKKTILKIKMANLKIQEEILLPAIALGVSPFIMQSTESLVQLTFNAQIKHYGGDQVDILISAMSILLSCMQFFVLPVTGLTQGAQPIVSYNYGAKKIDRVKKTFGLLVKSALIYTTTVWALVLLFPTVFIRLFSSDPQLLAIAPGYLRVFMSGMLLLGAQFSCQQTFVALGQAKVSMFLALLRKIILLIPLALILPLIMGFNGIFIAEPAADVLASLSTSTVFFLMTRKLFSGEKTSLND